MLGLTLEFDVSATGAVFDGEAEKAAADFTEHIKEVLADVSVAGVLVRLAQVLQSNHGTYMSYTHKEVQGDMIVVTDRWIIYGPWLEGVGTRVGPPGSGKWPLTRFMGYHTYRIVAQEVQLAAESIAYSELPPYLALMNQ
jgi:hypothetical protein